MKINAGVIIRLLIILFSLMTVMESFYYSGFSGGSDLRNRVVAARFMGKGYSPYFHKWKPADGERLLDPNDPPARMRNGCTVTPAVLYIIYPLTLADYPSIRLIWTILQLLTGVAIVWLMMRRYEGPSPLTAAAIVILGLLCSEYWFMHIERGQIPIFYVFLFVLMYYVYTGKWKFAEFISGFIGGLFIFFRPFAGMIGLGFFLHGKIKWVKGCITGVLTGMLIFVAPNPSLWKDYLHAMEEYGYASITKEHFIENAIIPIYPAIIEGTTNLKLSHEFNLTCMPAMYGIIRKLGIDYTPVLSYLTCGFILLILSFFFYKLKSRSTTISLFLFAFLTYKVLELFLMNWRSSYSLIEWVFPLFLIVQQIQNRSVQMILLVTALLFLHNVPFYFHYQVFIGEAILLLLVAYYAFLASAINSTGHGLFLTPQRI
jgi:Glycosyltransferase family 87